ncbi:helicase domain-containing protein [Alteromonas mediterranea UM7]|uniref:helicase-related protein n=1 Tax=Alteromonas mediterranea TaxID=314275 RepID=UPI000355663A|nr:helicase-related protein [Alteromonas mediterranea]AGP98000.1 helicase domain-containing protein [Alteromonas mediterranea UM7]
MSEELVGPCAYGEKFRWQDGKVKKKQINNPLISDDDGEEILKTFPIQRYGVGVLYPLEELDAIPIEESIMESVKPLSQSENEAIEPPSFSKQTILSTNDDTNDFDVSLANSRAPSSIGLSFVVDEAEPIKLKISVKGAFYEDFKVESDEGHIFNWWKRKPVSSNFEYPLVSENKKISIALKHTSTEPNLSEVYLEGVIRRYGDYRIVTLVLVNRSTNISSYIEKNKRTLFQAQFSVETNTLDGALTENILPYQSAALDLFSENLEEDELSNQLLYRNTPSFAKGHGVATDWNLSPYEARESVSSVWTESLPSFETPSITAEIQNEEETLTISMKELSEFSTGSLGELQLKQLIDWYEKWIGKLVEEKQSITSANHEYTELLIKQADKHISKCREAHIRMSEGLEVLQTNSQAKKAFKLANLAMLNQQKRAPKKIRKASLEEGTLKFDSEFSENASAKGIWRPFQIGFLLMCVSGAVNPEHLDHELVDLIWFPTGGGKTEAYLGLAAFTLLYNRLEYGEKAESVQVLMRYTLRLLTAQQLQRASTLICCLEVIRREHKIPGRQFSIGLWVGSKNTPNKRAVAKSKLSKIKSDLNKGEIENPFLLDRCPHCAAQLGVAGEDKKILLGYKAYQGTVKFHCEDKGCDFYNEIPIYLVDEDIYDKKPSLVIGTVDKFAMLAWEPKIRSLFGIDEEGERNNLPPQLIIQDELHLITGPLGTMVGLYEPLIEELCSYTNDNGKNIKPKIVCATATTKGYKDQIQSIYGRNRTDIFPPLGLTSEDSFFARYERDKSKKLKPGRKYVGVCAPGLGSVLTTQVRTHSALLFSSNRVNLENRDPWVTLLSFYNSIRELGGALTLFQADIISYLLELKRRYPSFLLPRFLNGGMELTSRLKDDEIPAAIALLERSLNISLLKPSDKFRAAITEETKKLVDQHQEIKETGDKLLTCLMTKGEISLEDYILVDEFIAACKANNIKSPSKINSLRNLLSGREVTPYCLASSIIEVGVDIDRLSLMSIVGQPKTTAQYIQVSGRVGRRADERPGLVTTIFNNAKPRDKSHYEDFRAYHQKLYAQVEPSSVTPYSRPSIERGFAALMIAYARQFSPIDALPKDIDMDLFDGWFDKLLELRIDAIKDHEKQDLNSFYERKFKHSWVIRSAKSDSWGNLQPDVEPSESEIMCQFGATGKKRHQLACPTSMRNVDGESVVWISPEAYLEPELDSWDDDEW